MARADTTSGQGRRTMGINYSQAHLIEACRLLFPGALLQHEFLQQLHMQSVKKAYREQAKRYHPDCCSGLADAPRRAELFRRAHSSYELLCAFIRERDVTAPPRIQVKAAPSGGEARGRQPFTERFFRPRTKPARNPDDVYYEGPLPTFPLKLGLFLYYKGVIPYSAVVKALIWQRDMRPPIGQLAVAWGWLDQRGVAVIRAATEINGTFGERAVQLGLLTEPQIRVLVLHQKMMQAHIGRYFVGTGYLTEYDLKKHLRELSQFNNEAARKRK